MGLPMWPTDPRPAAGIDHIKLDNVVEYAGKLCEHKDLPAEKYERIHKGLEACKEYLRDPEGASDEIFEVTNQFVMEYSKKRIQFCSSNLNDFIVRAINDAYQIAKIRSVLFCRDFSLTLEDIEDYCDYSPIIAQGLRCEHCFGHHYYNKANRDTGVQPRWIEIARALKRREKRRLPAYLWERLSAVDEDVTPGEAYIDTVIVNSFLEAAKATGADEDAMVWQVVKYADQVRGPGPKEFIRSEDWDNLASHTHCARVMFDAMWRGPVYLTNRQREAARTMAIAVALVQSTWFLVIMVSSDGQTAVRSEHRARQYPGPRLLERGELPHAMVSPGVELFDPALLHDKDHGGICSVDIMAPNVGMDIAGNRWVGDMSLFDQASNYYSQLPHERITQRRVGVLRMIFTVGADNADDWWDDWRRDLGVTSLMALRYPLMYSDHFLLDMMDIAGNPDSDGQLLRQHHVARLPGRGLVSVKRFEFDGLFGHETDLGDSEDRINAITQRLRESQYEGLESFLDGEPVHDHESLNLWRNRGASTILDKMNTLCLNDTDGEFTWTDLSIALRRATDSATAALYSVENCEKLIQLAGLPNEELNEEGWFRHNRDGILPFDLIQTE